MGVAYNPSIITDGLVLLLDAGNPKSYSGSGNDWLDLSGNKFHMSLKNSPTFVNDAGLKYFSLEIKSGFNISLLNWFYLSSAVITIKLSKIPYKTNTLT